MLKDQVHFTMSDCAPSTSKCRPFKSHDDVMELSASDNEGSFSGFEIDNENSTADNIIDSALKGPTEVDS
jgi:hypothetical protein